MKKQDLNKDKVLNLQQLTQVSGGRISDDVAPMDWSTMSNNCGGVGDDEWSTMSDGCKGGEKVIMR
ncbi:hypothetical protein [Rheinheimera baltica]|uniref:Natural product n=1 Tax=Rheinheimera baltica TaxID=67576 RepID=A0ABT9HXK9_9GAMM|nr:hypothetical protein [Rheinheimera baltica]MDP5135872.1 hypothetical protein [Rheinheimera baltica]MDP5151890.1 hypothetical protein [Rheinheimera baltica]MDP5189811.1 hypothetical protein [Rheinheimera baltica]